MTFDQSDFDIRCEWGLAGVRHLSPISDVIIIVDVFSFSTSIDIAISRGAIVYPYRWQDESASEFALSKGAELAGKNSMGYSLSPSTLVAMSPGTCLVLPSPNGSSLTLETGSTKTLAGCFRNAKAVAQAAADQGKSIGVIAAGEQWPDGSLRPALEDWIGAGAILRHLKGELSPESIAAIASFESLCSNLQFALERCGSGKEKQERGRNDDIKLAGSLDISISVPVFSGGAYHRGEV